MDGFFDIPNVEIAPTDTSGLDTGGPSQNLLGVVNIGNNKLTLDGQTGRIIVYDNSGIPRIVIGNV